MAVGGALVLLNLRERFSEKYQSREQQTMPRKTTTATTKGSVNVIGFSGSNRKIATLP